MKTILIPVAALLLVVGAASSQFIGHVESVDQVADAIAPVAIPATLDHADEAGPEVKLVLLALRPEGFDTNEMRLEPGEYLFIIGNRTGLREVNVTLEREGNGRVAAAAVGGRQRDFKKRLKLTTGSYVVTVDDNPVWACRILVGR